MCALNQKIWIFAAVGCAVAGLIVTPAEAVVIADSVAEFSGNQGQDNWFYGYYDVRDDATNGDGQYAAGDFIAFLNDGSEVVSTDPGFGEWRNWPNHWNGSKWDLLDNGAVGHGPWTEVTATGGHPAANAQGDTEIHWAMRRYQVEQAGDLQFNLNADVPGGGNTHARVFRNGELVHVRNLIGRQPPVQDTIVLQNLAVGDFIDLAIDPNGPDGSDGTVFGMTVDTEITPGARVLTGTVRTNSALDFSPTGTQDENGWSNGYYNVTVDGPYDATPGGIDDFIPFPNDGGPFSATNFWNGNAWDWFQGDPPWDFLGQTDAHPNGDNQAEEHWVIRRWESDVDGEIQIDWNLAKLNVNGGNGSTVKVLVNGVEVDSGTVAFDDAVGISRVVAATVQAGDFVDIALTAEGTDGSHADGSDGSTFTASILAQNAVELTWDGNGDGDWGEIVAGLSNWEDASGPVDWFPDVGSPARATINANTVTVAADRQASALTLTGTGAVEVDDGQELLVMQETTFDDGTSLTLGTGATLRTLGGGSIASLITTGDATIDIRGPISVGSLDDSGVAGTLVKAGTGTLALDNSAKSVSAAATTIKIEKGTISATGSNPLGGAPAVELAGGQLSITGPLKAPFAAWAFEDGSGNVAADSSGRGNGLDGDIVDGTWVTDDPDRGTVLSLDGDGDYINVGDLSLTSNTVTLAMWLNGHKMEDWAGIMMAANTRNGIGYGNNENLHYTWNGNSTWRWHDGAAIPDDQWVFVAATIAPDGTTTYVGSGGVLNSVENPVANAVETIDGLHIGYDFGSRFFAGLVDDAVIFDRALTQAEINDLFAGGQLPAATPLDLSSTTVTVSASSTLDVTSDGPSAFGPLRMEGGMLTTTGNAGIGFADTTVVAGAVDVGFETLVDTNPGAITAPGATIVKSGLADLVVDTAGGGKMIQAQDNSGAGGLIEEITHRKLPVRLAYLLILLVTVAVTWETNVNVIIAYASRAFALYYMLQCVVALLVARKLGKGTLRFAILALLCLLVFGLGVPTG